jgi:hypothetical protein
MKNLLKGSIPDEYRLDYEKTFSEQSDTIYEKLIPELKRLMEGNFNPSVTQLSNWLRAIHKHRRDRLRKRESGQLAKVDRRLHKNARLSEVSISKITPLFITSLFIIIIQFNICILFDRKKIDESNRH